MEKISIKINEAGIIWQEIEKAKKILLHLHPSPDGDSVGSNLAMKHALLSHFKKQNIQKDITVIKGDSDVPSYLSHAPGFDTIIQKNYFEINPAEYDLFLILDIAGPDRITKLGEIVFPPMMRTIVIDHHKTNTGFGDINVIDATYPATCQMLFDLFNQWNIEISHDTALCLFLGIYTDTGGFKYLSTSPKTLEIAAALGKIAPDFTDLLFSLDNTNTRGKLFLKGLLLTTIETFYKDSVAIAAVSFDTLQKNSITDEEAMSVDVANELKSVLGWNLGISAMEREKGIVKISFRTRDAVKYDVSKLAVALGGGGHAGAAGTRINGTVEEAKAKILAAISEVFPDLKE